MLWAASGVALPLATLIALYFRIAELDRSLPFAGLELLLAALYGLATETLTQRERLPGFIPGLLASGAMFATGTLAALALALTFALEKGWLTVAFSLMVPGAPWVAGERPLPWLRRLAAVMVGVVVSRIGYDPRRRRFGNDADLQLAALRLRHPGRGVLARRLAYAQTRR